MLHRLMPSYTIILFAMLSCAVMPAGEAHAEAADADSIFTHDNTITVFLDISRNYQNYIKTELTYVNYLRDPAQADVQILMTTRRTGSGGREYTLTFIGRNSFAAVNDTLSTITGQHDTEEMRRAEILQVIKLGLVPYLSRTPLAPHITIDIPGAQDVNGQARADDPWDYWVFTIDMDTDLEGEESKEELSIDGSLSADRVTDEWKLSFDLDTDYNRQEYDTDDRTITSSRRSHEFETLVVKSLGDHWSLGAYGSVEKSSYRNIDLSFMAAPAVEYNIFPYEESTHREFRFLYRLVYNSVDYVEETIFDKTSEHLYRQRLSAIYEVKERWGSIWTSLEGSHYMHDANKNRLELETNIDIRLFEGFSLDIYSNVSRIHDQLSLPRANATEEEILLNKRQLATQYDFFISVGLRYTFGSIYSNVVNPRMN